MALKNWLRSNGVLGWLVVINTGVFAATLVAALFGMIFRLPGNVLGPWLSLPASLSALATRPWTIATYMVTQFTFLHFLFNVLWLWWFGRIFLITLPEKSLLWLYIFGGLLGALFYVVSANLMGTTSSVLVGSSACVLAIMAASAIRTPDYSIPLMIIGPVKLKWLALVNILLVFIGLGGGTNFGGEMAHLGGLCAGVVYALCLRRGIDIFSRLKSGSPRPKHKPKKVAKAMKQHRDDTVRLDELLDKIRVSGYGSLSRAEQKELQALSQKLKKNV